ncbi:uncharacterized protein LOC110683660 isoform X2 [Chenopodium quinoa]|uniref:uncharacterized protein LOC110683660 isoform X2 n=1 Tax=Chenopodium quinoa TaxID=63459 RepID=UPI000B774E2E|nr:uncharacterized protein LOC110683660 isoform X2 [Chenopodium quinoa]
MGSRNHNENNVYNLPPFLEKDRLTGDNFSNWERMLRPVLKYEGREDVIDTPLPRPLPENPTVAEIKKHKEAHDRAIPITCLMIATMEPSLQKRFEDQDAYLIMQELKALFKKQGRVERYELHREILDCRMEKGATVHDHVFKMIDLIQSMQKLGHPYSDDLAIDIILHSLPESFNLFIMNFNMTATAKTMNQLHSMLVSAKKQIPKEPKKEVLKIQKGKGFKKKGQKASAKRKGKQVSKAPEKPKVTPKPKATSEMNAFTTRR